MIAYLDGLTLGFLLTHELDAMTAKEWRIFPGLSRLPDETGRWWFVALHVPLFAVLLAGLTGESGESWTTGLNIFAVAHMLAHLALHRHPENGFRRPLSWILIAGAAATGTASLALSAI